MRPAWVHRLLAFFSRSVPAPAGRVQLGRRGEERAADFLSKERSMQILARNWRPRRGHGEIDIIARDGATLVFVEVRARDAGALVSGYHSIDRHKKQVTRRTCLAYLRRLPTPPGTIRFDVISLCTRDGQIADLHHYRNVPLFRKTDR